MAKTYYYSLNIAVHRENGDEITKEELAEAFISALQDDSPAIELFEVVDHDQEG